MHHNTITPQHHNTVLVTGSAGFIGYHVVNRFLEAGFEVVGVDNLNAYYDPQLKLDRLAAAGIGEEAVEMGCMLTSTVNDRYRFVRMDLSDPGAVRDLFAQEGFDRVVHLAAQPGVRYSIDHPEAYIQSNVVAFLHVLEGCRHHKVQHLVYASSSSVYGLNAHMPLSVSANVDHPISLYAATKKSNELMAHTYSHLYGIPTTGLRFFTVYGSWGRPDMAYHLFATAIREGRTIKIFNEGKLSRDFTHVSDIAEGVYQVSNHPPAGNPDWSAEHPDPATSLAPYRIYNLGNSQPVQLMDFIEAIEQAMGQEATKEYLPMQPGDVEHTFADVQDLQAAIQYKPSTPLQAGIKEFVDWYSTYYT